MPSKQVEDAFEAQQAGAPPGVTILRRGTLPEKRTHEATCGWCRTEIRFEERAAKRVNNQVDGDFFWLACPVCGRDMNAPVPRGL